MSVKVPVAQFDSTVIENLKNSDDGKHVQASAAATGVIRNKIREDGFQRKILPFREITDKNLMKTLDHELPQVYGEMEPDSPAAKCIPYNASPDTAFFHGDKFAVILCIISTPEFAKDINELRTYDNDFQQIVTDNSIRDIHTEEDTRWIASVDRIVGSEVNFASATEDTQNVFFNGEAITRNRYRQVLNFIEDRDLNNGVFLINRRTEKAFLTFDRTEFGGDMAEKLMMEGLKAMPKNVIFGVPHIATIKKALVPNNVIYGFCEENYLGRAYMLDNIEVTVEKKKNVIRFCAQEQIGATIANTRAVQRTRFELER